MPWSTCYILCVYACVCVRVRHRQRRVCTDLVAMAGTPLRSVSMQAVCVCVCVFDAHACMGVGLCIDVHEY